MKPLPSFGRRLRQQRRVLGLKQLVIAHEVGVDQATVSRWESGKQ
ncbi:helix-turn-helix transcriptional regulator [uncultured Roseobacter sp.]|nr:helix-turn-helix transcriptional regulator [uncultured Roseobacter sp.]